MKSTSFTFLFANIYQDIKQSTRNNLKIFFDCTKLLPFGIPKTLFYTIKWLNVPILCIVINYDTSLYDYNYPFLEKSFLSFSWNRINAS